MNLSWGTKIAGLYIGFVLLMITMVIMSAYQKTELVSDDYYERELKYQDKIDGMNNANLLSAQISHTINDNALIVQFPNDFKNKNVTGEIVFFRPSDKTKDFISQIRLNETFCQTIDLKDLSKGMYKMQTEWKADGKTYFNEETIVIP